VTRKGFLRLIASRYVPAPPIALPICAIAIERIPTTVQRLACGTFSSRAKLCCQVTKS
jgi:hypothetical protein